MIKNNPFFQKYGAYLVAAVLFFALAFIYCFPVLQGKVIYAGDNVNAECACREGVAYTEATGDHSWWTGSMFCGMPNYQIGGGQYKSEMLMKPFETVLHMGHSHTAWVFIIYFFCFFILLRSFDVDKWLAIVGAIAVALSSYFVVIIAAGHNGKTSTIALMSVVFAGFHLIFKKKYGIGVILTMLFTAVGFHVHPQMAYYIFMMIGVCWFAEFYAHIKGKRIKDFLIGTVLFVGAVGIGLGTGCANVFANAEYTTQTMRGGHSELVKDNDSANKTEGLDLDYATAWSYGKLETFSLLVPGVQGGASGVDVGKDSRVYKVLKENGVSPRDAAGFCKNVPMYWGDQPFTAGNVYVGAIICFLFVLGLMIVKGPYKWALLVSTLFSILLAWGSNFMWFTKLFFNYFPLYNKFRAVSSILIVAEIAMPLLGFVAIKKLMDGDLDKKLAIRKIFTAAGITGGIALIFALLGGLLFDFTSAYDIQFKSQLPEWLYDAILAERKSLLIRDSWRSVGLIAASAGIMAAFAAGKMKKKWMIALLGVLVLVDMWPVDRRYMNDDNFVSKRQNSSAYAMQPYEHQILQDPDIHFRVFNATSNTFNDSRTSYYLKSIGGYHAAKLRRYQDMIEVYLSKGNMKIINLLNAKYLIVPGEDGTPAPVLNPEAFGNAWFVGSISAVASPNEEIAALDQIDLHTEAVMDQEFAPLVKNMEPGIAEGANVRLTCYTPRYLNYEYSSSKDGVIVFSEIYYPFGWKASIDGEAVDHYRVDYTLRALDVPAGEHKIHFEFDPDSVRIGDTIAIVLVCLMYLIILGLICFAVFRKVRK